MNALKRQVLKIIDQRAVARAATLSREYINAAPGEKEAIQAGIRFERWFTQISQECLR